MTQTHHRREAQWTCLHVWCVVQSNDDLSTTSLQLHNSSPLSGSVSVHRCRSSAWVPLPIRPAPERRDRLPHADVREALPHRAGNAAQRRRIGRGNVRITWREGFGETHTFDWKTLSPHYLATICNSEKRGREILICQSIAIFYLLILYWCSHSKKNLYFLLNIPHECFEGRRWTHTEFLFDPNPKSEQAKNILVQGRLVSTGETETSKYNPTIFIPWLMETCRIMH